MSRRVCSFDIVAVPDKAYVVMDNEGEIYLCNARCLCLWSMTLATKSGLPEDIKRKPLKLYTPNPEELRFESIIELARWAATNALQRT